MMASREGRALLENILAKIAPSLSVDARRNLEARATDSDGHVREAWVWLALGDYYYHDSDYERARTCYRSVQKAVDTDAETRARALFGLGNCYQMEFDCLEARAAYLDALQLAESVGLSGAVAEILIQMSNVERPLGYLSEAEANIRRALTLSIERGREPTVRSATQAIINLASYLDAAGDRNAARKLLEWSSQTMKAAKAEFVEDARTEVCGALAMFN
jgi:tetratricopeptide (TPR) repeat protein